MRSCRKCGYDMLTVNEVRGYPINSDEPEVYARRVVCVACGYQGPWHNTLRGAMQAWNKEAERE